MPQARYHSGMHWIYISVFVFLLLPNGQCYHSHRDDVGTLAGDVQNWAILIQNYILQVRTSISYHILVWGLVQGFGQDLESGCPKSTIIKIWGVNFFKADKQYTQINTINIYVFLNEIKHSVHIQCHGNYNEEKTIQLCA